MKKNMLILAASVFVGLHAFAGECVMTIDRTPCPGKEAEAREPYKGVNPTIEKKGTADEKACLDLSKKACKIVRKGTLSKKSLTGKFDGKALEAGGNICASVPESAVACK